jgi:hypothetical protein
MMAAIAAAMALPATAKASALNSIGPYVSRGKGKDRRSGKKPGNRTGKTYQMNGAREVARRLRQIKAGQLRVSEAA